MAMEYVVLRLDRVPEWTQHAQMARSVPATVESAGRVYLENGKLFARGSSASLGVSSREQDSEIIQGYFEGQGIIQAET